MAEAKAAMPVYVPSSGRYNDWNETLSRLPSGGGMYLVVQDKAILFTGVGSDVRRSSDHIYLANVRVHKVFLRIADGFRLPPHQPVAEINPRVHERRKFLPDATCVPCLKSAGHS